MIQDIFERDYLDFLKRRYRRRGNREPIPPPAHKRERFDARIAKLAAKEQRRAARQAAARNAQAGGAD